VTQNPGTSAFGDIFALAFRLRSRHQFRAGATIFAPLGLAGDLPPLMLIPTALFLLAR